MVHVTHYKNARQKRKIRSRIKMHGTKERPRVTVFRSNHAMFVQFVDDGARITLLGMSDKEIGAAEKNKIKRAHTLGKKLAEAAQDKKITTIVFDRSGYAYHGRLKALAEGMREGGLVF